MLSDIYNQMNKLDYSLLWSKIGEYARKAGRTAARPVLLLYFVMKSPGTPRKDKVIIGAALAYLLLPVDLISARRYPLLGLMDNLLSLAVVYKKVSKHITPEIEQEADATLERWFSR